jgi:hypothetical protein
VQGDSTFTLDHRALDQGGVSRIELAEVVHEQLTRMALQQPERFPAGRHRDPAHERVRVAQRVQAVVDPHPRDLRDVVDVRRREPEARRGAADDRVGLEHELVPRAEVAGDGFAYE